MTRAEELAARLGASVSDFDGRRVVPMLCERESERALERKGWLFELKLDGVRIIADKRGEQVALGYRKLRDATASYREVAEAIARLGEERLVLDGEIVAFDEAGHPDFQRLGTRIHGGKASLVPVVYVVFDVLAVGKYDLRGLPLEARKAILALVVPAGTGVLRAHPTFDSGVPLFALCRAHGLEGVVAKKLGSRYQHGERTGDWLKIKAELEAEFVVVGWLEGEGDRATFGALEVGAYEGERLVVRGRVGSGLDHATIELLSKKLGALEVAAPVAHGKYPKARRHHCRPEVVVSVRYLGFSVDSDGERSLRAGVFRGIRPDVDPRDCTTAPDERRRSSKPRKPVKDVFSQHFEIVAPALLRHTRGRTCSLSRADRTKLLPPPVAIDSVEVLKGAAEAGYPFVEHDLLRGGRCDGVVLRARGEGRARVAAAVRTLAREIGLPVVPTSAGAAAIDLRIGVVGIAAATAAPLAALLAQLTGAEAVASVAAAFGPCIPEDGRLVFAAPLEWDEIPRLDLARLGAEEAQRRMAMDAFAVLEQPVDAALVVAAIERIALRR